MNASPAGRTAGAGLVLVLVLAGAGCGPVGNEGSNLERQGLNTATTTASSAPSPDKAWPGASSTGAHKNVIVGTFDAGGHKLFMRCEGRQSPTVVYMHGSITSPVTAHASGSGFQRLLADDYRTCVYDRRNVGDSDTVDATQRPADALQDMRNLLRAGDIAPPYVLVGASFGGMLAYLYANEHPDEVVGMVLLDAMFPDELSLEYLFPPEERYEAFSRDDETNSIERISHFKVLTAGQRFIGNEPDIPVTYLASTVEGYEDNDYRIPEYDRKILKLQAAYVHRFAPGRLVKVDVGHFMEPVIPGRIAAAARQVIGSADSD